MTCGIYEIVHTATKYRYVGQSTRIEERWDEHKRQLNRGVHRHLYLQEAWTQHGQASFAFRILECLSPSSENKHMLHARERFWVSKRKGRLYNEMGLCPEQKRVKSVGAAIWPFPGGLIIIPRRHHLGPPAGVEERRKVMYSGRRDHLRLAEIQAEIRKQKLRHK